MHKLYSVDLFIRYLPTNNSNNNLHKENSRKSSSVSATLFSSRAFCCDFCSILIRLTYASNGVRTEHDTVRNIYTTLLCYVAMLLSDVIM